MFQVIFTERDNYWRKILVVIMDEEIFAIIMAKGGVLDDKMFDNNCFNIILDSSDCGCACKGLLQT